jgi:hypothetical protein
MTFELTAEEAARHPDPYRDVDLRVEFRSPRFRTMPMPAFWDGGNKMVVRFAPVEAGEWSYHVTSNLSGWNDRTGAFTAAASNDRGFIRAANVHHWEYTARSATGLDQPHLWMGATEMQFAVMEETAFRAMADARAAQKFNHLRGFVIAGPPGNAYTDDGRPSAAYFRRLDSRIRYLNEKGLIVDLALAGAGTLTQRFPSRQDRRRFVQYLVARYSAFNVTWQGVERFEDYPNGRALLQEIGSALKDLDPYQHPRSSGARITSSPLLDDGWEDYVALRTADDAIPSIEHQILAAPLVTLDFRAEGDSGASAFRHRLWNATVDGQYVTYAGTSLDSADVQAMTVWYNFFDSTRHWELEPYFDVNGGRALALEGTEYVVYVEHPEGPVELTVEKHGYDVYWVNPANGETIKAKKYSGEYFTGEPPDRSHDWVLHVVREGRVESMNRSYKLESREVLMQEVEANTEKVPFVIEAPTGDLSLSKPVQYAVKMTKQSRATRWMMFLWKGEVAASHQGYRILATGPRGSFSLPRDLSSELPATMHLRLYGMNANGKVYELDAACGITQ